MRNVRWAFLCALSFIYGAAGTVLITLGVVAIGNLLLTESNESLDVLGGAWAGAGIGLGLIGAGSFALIISLLAFIENAVADIGPGYKE